MHLTTCRKLFFRVRQHSILLSAFFLRSSVVILAVDLPNPCSTINAAPPTAEIAKELDVVYARPNGESLQLDAYRQPSPGPQPAVVFVHGGGFVTGDKRPCPSYILEPYLKNGYSVFSVNYRLAPQHPFPAATDDVATAVTYIKEHAAKLRIDPKRVVLTGESAGGLISAFVGATLQGENQVAAVIPMCGEFDLELRVSEDPCSMDGHTVPRPSGGCISKGLAAFLGFAELKTEAQRIKLRAASTIAHIRPGMPPYLLVHGTRDFGVPYEQSVSLQQAMTKIGVDCVLLPVVGGGHGNWTPEQWREVEQAELAWLAMRLNLP